MAISAEVSVLAMSESVQSVYRALGAGRPLKVTEIQRKTQFSPRTIRSALARLRSQNLIVQVPDLNDLRSHFYKIKETN